MAKDLDVKRNWRGTSGDIPDVKDDYLSIEVKNQKAVPKFLYKALSQAEDHSEGKVPMAVVRKKYKQKKIAIIDWEDFLHIYKQYKYYKKKEFKDE
ncbi:MAG: hypothetical protein ACOC44_18925 [Promethearchaeia archaeon]